MVMVETADHTLPGTIGMVRYRASFYFPACCSSPISDRVSYILICLRGFVLTCSSSPTRVHGTFDKELVLRHIVAGLRSAQLKLARTLEEKYRNSPEATSSQDTDISSDAETKSVLQIEVQRLGGENPRDIPVSDDSGKGVKIKRYEENIIK
jgi:hypothetical protein